MTAISQNFFVGGIAATPFSKKEARENEWLVVLPGGRAKKN
jgi:hypothetical protein